ncbi:hypothetical protein Calkr_2652 (plasmid) [Caldicellulosiruptor acetigenus I77R1B]|uniref:Uncharacterized protein n=1 Tax=Caldicellulosiruptor acetigenus (strain ATCC 700853 / DSM 12137 / I77R1B) TaxID=632335 RepID=E4SAZ6_CALA7|nr:RusA family crossover junction endodeoxyribonuclease [Caldicellulosiruptor acetigenus]ADQ42075.1 hypothetical protein Calkr_2652 [Caldicellulosiruptor acetigenus I77R1B]
MGMEQIVGFLEMLNKVEQKLYECSSTVQEMIGEVEDFKNKLDEENKLLQQLEPIEKYLKETEYNICRLKGKVTIEKDKLNRLVSACSARKPVDDTSRNPETPTDCIEFAKPHMVLRFEIDEIPPRWRNSNSTPFLKRVRTIVEDAIEKIPNLPQYDKVHILIEIYFPGKGYRVDLDNLMIKTIIDAIKQEQIVKDDNIEMVSLTVIGYKNSQAKTVVTIIPVERMVDIVARLLPVSK